MSFSLRLAIAITLVVLVALGVGAAVGGPAIRESFLTALRNTLLAHVDGISAVQQFRQQVAMDYVQRMTRSSRLVAAMTAGNPTLLAQTGEDELRFALARGGAGSTFLFMDNKGSLIANRPGDTSLATEIAAALKPIAIQDHKPTMTYLPLHGGLLEVLVAPVIDLIEDERLGTLALAIPFVPPAALTLEDGTPLEVGIHMDHTLFGTSLSGAGRDAAQRALNSLGDRENARFMNDGNEYVAHARTISERPPTQFVAIVSLAPLVAAERDLTLRMSIAAAVALCVGLAITVYLARTLSRPVADMSAAAVAIEGGDYSVRVPVRDSGELGALAARFNSMGQGLALRDQYRRVLDVVADPEVARELMAGKLDLGGRSQEVGVLFCDIRGFTSLTERMDPPHVIGMLNEHMSLMTRIAYEHGGVVDKFVGDLIMVTFGAPKGSPDDAARMVACARAMIDGRHDANQRMATPIEVGIGCAFGTVVAGCMGSTQRLDYTVLGARVNLAARLCSRAPAMCVYIDAETKARAPMATCETLAAFEVKGFSQPILAFKLERASTGT